MGQVLSGYRGCVARSDCSIREREVTKMGWGRSTSEQFNLLCSAFSFRVL